MQRWTWLLISLGVVLVIYAAFVVWLCGDEGSETTVGTRAQVQSRTLAKLGVLLPEPIAVS